VKNEQRWQEYGTGLSSVRIAGTDFVLTPGQGGLLPEELHGLYIVTSDNPGGIVRDPVVNRERRSDMRVDLVSLLVSGGITKMYQSCGSRDASFANPEVGFAVDMDEAHALVFGHAFGQDCVYHLVPEGRRLLSCALIQDNRDSRPQPMICSRRPAARDSAS